MDREEALRLIALGILSTGDAGSRREALEQAKELLDEYLRDPLYVIAGVEVPVEMVTGVLANFTTKGE